MMLVFLFLWNSSLGFATCNSLAFQLLTPTVSLNTDPNPQLTVRVSRQGGQACNFFITVDYGQANSYQSRALYADPYTIPVQICSDQACTGILKKLPDATSAGDVLSGSFPQGSGNVETTDLSFRAKLGAISYNRFGFYTDAYNFVLYDGSIGSGTPIRVDNATLKLSYNLARQIDLSIVPSGAPFSLSATSMSMNFGALDQSSPQSFDLILQFNAGYQLRFSSLNNGALKNMGNTDTVPYTLSLNNNPVNLGGSSTAPVLFGSGSGVSPAGGLRLAGKVSTGSTARASAGTYTDSITISVASNE